MHQDLAKMDASFTQKPVFTKTLRIFGSASALSSFCTRIQRHPFLRGRSKSPSAWSPASHRRAKEASPGLFQLKISILQASRNDARRISIARKAGDFDLPADGLPEHGA